MPSRTEIFKVADSIFSISFHETFEILRPYLYPYAPFRHKREAGEAVAFHCDVTLATDIRPTLPVPVCSFPYGAARFHIFKDQDHYEILLMNPQGKFISKLCSSPHFDSNHLALTGNPSDCFLGFDNALMMAFAFSGAPGKRLLVHASAVVWQGKAFLFLGKSGTGKSTHAGLWLRHVPGTTLLNDDNPALRITDEGQVVVCGTPWSGKTPCYRNEACPLDGIVRLRQAPHNRIAPSPRLEAFASLFSACSCIPQEKNSYDACIQNVTTVVSQAPVFRLDCLPNEAAVHLCAQALTHE